MSKTLKRLVIERCNWLVDGNVDVAKFLRTVGYPKSLVG